MRQALSPIRPSITGNPMSPPSGRHSGVGVAVAVAVAGGSIVEVSVGELEAGASGVALDSSPPSQAWRHRSAQASAHCGIRDFVILIT
jgi:hypothetical protein